MYCGALICHSFGGQNKLFWLATYLISKFLKRKVRVTKEVGEMSYIMPGSRKSTTPKFDCSSITKLSEYITLTFFPQGSFEIRFKYVCLFRW